MLAASLGGIAACSGCAPPQPPPAPAAQVALDAVTWSEFAGERLARRVRADQLLVVPRRMGPLQLTALSELVLTRPRIEVFGGSEESEEGEGAVGTRGGEAAASPAAEALLARGRPALPGLGSVRHLVAATLLEPTFTFVRGGAPVARLEAGRASVSVRSRDLVLRGVRVEQVPAGRRLTAERAVWLADADALWIEGDYVLWDGGASTRGRGLRIDVELRRARPR